MKVSTRKFLAPIDLIYPERKVKGFLLPDINTLDSFVEINSGKRYEAGLVVYVGKKIDAIDVKEKTTTFGSTLDIEGIESYLLELTTFKVGDIVGLEPSEGTFRLVKRPAPARKSSKLPT